MRLVRSAACKRLRGRRHLPHDRGKAIKEKDYLKQSSGIQHYYYRPVVSCRGLSRTCYLRTRGGSQVIQNAGPHRRSAEPPLQCRQGDHPLTGCRVNGSKYLPHHDCCSQSLCWLKSPIKMESCFQEAVVYLAVILIVTSTQYTLKSLCCLYSQRHYRVVLPLTSYDKAWRT